jgi:transposase-like protein
MSTPWLAVQRIFCKLVSIRKALYPTCLSKLEQDHDPHRIPGRLSYRSRRRIEEAADLVLESGNAGSWSYLQGVSTRRVQDIASRLGIEELSASSVSRIAKELDEKVEDFLKRPIEQPIHYLFVDASYFKVRNGSRYVTKAFLVVVGVRDDGYREILGARIADGETSCSGQDYSRIWRIEVYPVLSS